MNISVLPQETSSGAKFISPIYMTSGFRLTFGNESSFIVQLTMTEIRKRVCSNDGADYLQSCIANGIKYWVIDDGNHITFLLPEEY